MGIRCAYHVTPFYPQKLALTSPTGSGRSVGIVRSQTKATEFYRLTYFGSGYLILTLPLQRSETAGICSSIVPGVAFNTVSLDSSTRCVFWRIRKIGKKKKSSRLSVCPHGTTLFPLDRFSWNFDIREIFENLSTKIQVTLQSDNNNRYFTCRPIYICNHISLSSS